jgi:hypothetical protein
MMPELSILSVAAVDTGPAEQQDRMAHVGASLMRNFKDGWESLKLQMVQMVGAWQFDRKTGLLKSGIGDVLQVISVIYYLHHRDDT